MLKLILIFILGVQFFGYAQSPEGLCFENLHLDLGVVTSNNDANGIFKFSNTSNTSIEILNIHGQNHCVEIDTSSLKSFAPKAKGEIKINYNLSCKGPIRKTISVFTSFSKEPITLKLTGKILE